MMQQLVKAKSADGGQQEEKSGGSGRRDANDDSGGAGRAPPKKAPLEKLLVPQHKRLQGEKCPATAAECRMDQDLYTKWAGNQRFQLSWVR